MSITIEDLEFEESELPEIVTIKPYKLTAGFTDSCDDMEVISLGSHSETDLTDVKIEKKETSSLNCRHEVWGLEHEESPARQEEKSIKQNKWEMLYRIGNALGIVRRTSKNAGSPVEIFGLDHDDDLSFDGHLFEYSVHPSVVPQVEVPRLRLKKTLKERVVSVVRRLFVCGNPVNKRQYEYRID